MERDHIESLAAHLVVISPTLSKLVSMKYTPRERLSRLQRSRIDQKLFPDGE